MLPIRMRRIRDHHPFQLLVAGVCIGYLIGLVAFYSSDSDVKDHVRILESIDKPIDVSKISSIYLRCIVIIHPDAVNVEKILSAIDDGYARQCNQTHYFTNNNKMFAKYSKKYKMTYVDAPKQIYHWSFYRTVIETASQLTSNGQWSFVGDDQTYLVAANLRNVLIRFNPLDRHILGKVVDSRNILSWLFPFTNSNRVSIRAGIVASSSAMKLLAKCNGFFFPRSSEYSLYECSREHNIILEDPFDGEEMRQFHDLPPHRLIIPPSQYLLWNKRPKCCSDKAITFGQLSMKDMRVIEYGMNVKVFGKAGYTIDESDEDSMNSTNSTAKEL